MAGRRQASWQRWYDAVARSRWESAVWYAGGWLLFGLAYVAAVVWVANGLDAPAGDVVLVLAAGANLSRFVGVTVGDAEFLRWTLDASQRLVWLEDFAAQHAGRPESPVPDRLDDAIRFEGVSFTYPGSDRVVLDDIELVGTAINATDTAANLTFDLAAQIAVVREAVAGEPAPRTFYEVGLFEGAIYTAGMDSFLAGLIDTAGGEPITGDALTTAIALEDLVAADPELILLGDAAYDPSITPESVASRPGWEAMTAVTTGRVEVVEEDPLITRPGPRVVDGLEALARHIHPDAFD